MRKYAVLVVLLLSMSFLISSPCTSATQPVSKNLGETEDIGPENWPNYVALGAPFHIKYLYGGPNATIYFYPLLVSTLPWEFGLNEYHGVKYENISDLIRVSEQESNSWEVFPQVMHVSPKDSVFNIKVTLYYGGEWDMFILLKYSNGSYAYVLHSIPTVISPKNNMFVLWFSLYTSAVALSFSLYRYISRKNVIKSRKHSHD